MRAPELLHGRSRRRRGGRGSRPSTAATTARTCGRSSAVAAAKARSSRRTESVATGGMSKESSPVRLIRPRRPTNFRPPHGQQATANACPGGRVLVLGACRRCLPGRGRRRRVLVVGVALHEPLLAGPRGARIEVTAGGAPRGDLGRGQDADAHVLIVNPLLRRVRGTRRRWGGRHGGPRGLDRLGARRRQCDHREGGLRRPAAACEGGAAEQQGRDGPQELAPHRPAWDTCERGNLGHRPACWRSRVSRCSRAPLSRDTLPSGGDTPRPPPSSRNRAAPVPARAVLSSRVTLREACA